MFHQQEQIASVFVSLTSERYQKTESDERLNWLNVSRLWIFTYKYRVNRFEWFILFTSVCCWCCCRCFGYIQRGLLTFFFMSLCRTIIISSSFCTSEWFYCLFAHRLTAMRQNVWKEYREKEKKNRITQLFNSTCVNEYNIDPDTPHSI